MQCWHSAWNVISITHSSYGGSLSFIFTLEPSVSPSHRHGSEKQQQLELLVICLLFHFRPQRISKVFWCFLGRVFLMDKRGVAAGKLYEAGRASWSQGVGTPSGSFCSLAPQRTFSGSGRSFSRSTHLSLELDIHDVMIWSVSASPPPRIHFLVPPNKAPQTEQLQPQKCIASQFWRQEVQDENVDRAGSSEHCGEKLFLSLLPSWRFAGSLWCVFLCKHHPHLCLHLHKAPS